MNELNIYTKFNYKKVLKNANLCFDNKYIWYNPKTVFAPRDGTYTITLNKRNVRICYWDEYTSQGLRNKKMIRKFIEENFHQKVLGVICQGRCDLIDGLDSVTIIHIR